MNSTKLIARVQEVVKDASFSDSEILGYLNTCLQNVAHEHCLPGLQTTDDLSFAVGDDSVPLPDDFSHDLWHVEPLTKTQRIKLHSSPHSLQRIYDDSDTGGTITDAAQDGVKLHARPIPTDAQDVRVHYYRAPDALVLADAEADPVVAANSPEGIPAHLHDRILVSYAALQCFSIIEDGIDGAKVNSDKYERRYMEGLRALAALPAVRNAERFTPYVKRHARFF